jgi:signal transduction histidine kinase/CheY-like chemotaxis protein
MDQPRELLGDDSRGSRLEPPSELRPDRVELVLSSASGREVTLEARAMRAEFRRSPVDLWFCRDVTEHRELEARLMQADRLATLGTLAGGLAHAINNPLSSMLLNLEDLVRRMPQLSERPELSESVQGRLAMAKEAADRVAGVVAQLRIFSRMRMSDAIDDVDVRRVVEDGIELVANEIRHRGQLELALRPVPMVRGIEGRIEQALLTLLIFAVRLLPDRPGGPSRLVIETGLGGGHVEVMVRCEGAPLPAEGLQTLSDPFAGSGTRDRGLGLAICGDIVRSMGGELVIRGSADASSFCVRLPAPARDAGAEAQVEPSRGHDADARGRRARVLAIDDDPGVLSALRLMLQDDHDVTVLQSAGEAVKEIVGGASYDVVFCDFVMPEMTGEDVYEAVRRDRPGFERRIVFMTGAAFQRDAEAFLARVANDRVDKPFNLERVEALVRRAVE